MGDNELVEVRLGKGTESFVYCPECGKVLYEMPVGRNNIDITRFRVVLNTIYGHSDFLTGHDPVLIYRTNGRYFQAEENF